MAEVATKKLVAKPKAKKERTLSQSYIDLSKAVNVARRGNKFLNRFEAIRQDAVSKLSEAVDMAAGAGAYTAEEADSLKSQMETANSVELGQLSETIIKHILFKKTVR